MIKKSYDDYSGTTKNMKNSKIGYKNPFSATLEGITAVFARQVKVGKLSARERLDGMTVLVDGASAGLGFAIAVRMASRGARVVMACRSGIPEKGEKVKKLSGNPNVQMVHVDFADLRSIENLVKDLRANYPPFDIVISNAAMVPRKSRQTPQGLEEMFMVNYLSKFIFINGLIRLRRGTLPPTEPGRRKAGFGILTLPRTGQFQHRPRSAGYRSAFDETGVRYFLCLSCKSLGTGGVPRSLPRIGRKKLRLSL